MQSQSLLHGTGHPVLPPFFTMLCTGPVRHSTGQYPMRRPVVGDPALTQLNEYSMSCSNRMSKTPMGSKGFPRHGVHI
jgi:hypothetical protein